MRVGVGVGVRVRVRLRLRLRVRVRVRCCWRAPGRSHAGAARLNAWKSTSARKSV